METKVRDLEIGRVLYMLSRVAEVSINLSCRLNDKVKGLKEMRFLRPFTNCIGDDCDDVHNTEMFRTTLCL